MDVVNQLRIKCKHVLRYLFIFLCLISIFPSFADSLSDMTNNNAPWVAGVSIGSGKLHLQKDSTTVFNGSDQPAPYNVDVYTATQPGTETNWSFFVGYDWTRDSAFIPQYSLALRYQHLGSFGMKGDITQYSSYTNYNYHLNASSSNLMLLGKLDLYRFYSLFPYVSLGLGEASNKISDYSEQPGGSIIPRLSPGYRGTQHDFAYSVGLGVDYTINSQLSMSLGYEYANLGKLQAKGAVGSGWENEILSFGTLKSNTFLLSVSYRLPPL